MNANTRTNSGRSRPTGRRVRRVAGLLGGTAAAAVLAAPAALADAGGIDPAFGSDNVVSGQVVTPFSKDKDAVYALAVQKDGKILAVGDSGTGLALARYCPDGRLDPAFGTGGKRLSAIGKLAEGRAVAVQPDGKIVVAGYSVEPGVGSNFALQRFLPNGQSDRAFGYGGRVVDRISSQADAAYAVAVQPDGKIVAVGTSGKSVAVARYGTDGKRDSSFGKGGAVVSKLGTSDRGSAVALQPDGKIVVAGSSSAKGGAAFLVARYTPAGVLDKGFGTKGAAAIDFKTTSGTAHGVALQKNGKIVAAGTVDGHIAAARYTADGKADATFGDKGRVVTQVGSASEGRAVAVQPDDKVVVSGFSTEAGNGDSVAVVRYDADGDPDTGFGKNGVAISDFGTPSDRGHAVALQADGNIVVGGRSHDPVNGDSFALVRFLGA